MCIQQQLHGVPKSRSISPWPILSKSSGTLISPSRNPMRFTDLLPVTSGYPTFPMMNAPSAPTCSTSRGRCACFINIDRLHVSHNNEITLEPSAIAGELRALRLREYP
jgi:hypothetical protein